MAIVDYGNVNAGEQVEKTIRIQYPSPSELGEDPYISTGWTETIPYKGTYGGMLAQAESYATSASFTNRYDITLKRIHDSGKAELTVTRTTYVLKPGIDDEEGGEGESGEPGDSRDNPTYTIETSVVEQPILLHPMFNMSGEAEEVLLGLKAYQDGASPSDYIEYQGTDYTVLDLCTKSANSTAVFNYLKKGVVAYLMPVMEVSCQYKSKRYDKSRNATVGQIVSSIPGNPPLPAGKKILSMGCGISKDADGIFHYDERFKVADWDPTLYSSSN